MSQSRLRAVKPSLPSFLLALVGIAVALCLASNRADAAIPPGGVLLEDASLEWLGNPEIQSKPFAGGSNYLSAGVSDGSEATYRSVVGDAAVFQVSMTGTEKLATYETRAEHTTDGGRQVVRLYGGEGQIDADGSGAIAWEGSFSVNFYGGLVPFTISDPELVFAEDETGFLVGLAKGCAASQSEPGKCTPLPEEKEVTLATFSNVAVDPTGTLTIEPEYGEVEVESPPGAAKQNRTTPGWGAWPQDFVDFQGETGLASFFYSTGSASDPKKPPLPFTVNFDGGNPPADPTAPAPEIPAGDPPATGPLDPPSTPQTPPAANAKTATATPPSGSAAATPGPSPARIRLTGAGRDLDARGYAKVATIACPAGALAPCRAIVPKRTAVRIGGKRFLVAVLAPRKVMPGETAKIRVRLPQGALDALGDGTLILRIPIAVRTGSDFAKKSAKVKIGG